MRKILAMLAGLLLTAATLTACGGHSPVAKMPVDQRLAAAKKAFDDTSGVNIALKAKHLPKSVSGVLSATGLGTHQPAFKGTISVFQNGLSLGVPIVAVDHKVYANFGSWQVVDPAQYNAPDPAALMNPANGLSTLLTTVTKTSGGKEQRAGKKFVTTITGVVPGATVAHLIPSADAGSDFDAEFTLDADNHLTTAVLAGKFYPDAGRVTYTFTFDGYGTQATIKAP